jgi:hypothetical protein
LLCPCGGHDESADVCVVIQIDGSELGRFNHFGDIAEWQSWIAELFSPFTDRDHVEIHVGNNFRAIIAPKNKVCVLSCSYEHIRGDRAVQNKTRSYPADVLL